MRATACVHVTKGRNGAGFAIPPPAIPETRDFLPPQQVGRYNGETTRTLTRATHLPLPLDVLNLLNLQAQVNVAVGPAKVVGARAVRVEPRRRPLGAEDALHALEALLLPQGVRLAGHEGLRQGFQLLRERSGVSLEVPAPVELPVGAGAALGGVRGGHGLAHGALVDAEARLGALAEGVRGAPEWALGGWGGTQGVG